MSAVAWPSVALGEVVNHRKEFIVISDLETYRRPRVQLHAQGVVLRDAVPGALIKTKKQQVARAGEFLVAEIDAKVGGFGIVPADLDGSVVSSHYFLFGHNPDRVDNRFLGWFIKTPTFRQQVEAQGSTNYAAIRPADVLGYKIPLPPLDEQRRIVARIEELAAKVEEARTYRVACIQERDALFDKVLANRRRELSKMYPLASLGSLTKVTSGGTPSRDNPAYWGGTVPWIKTGELVDGDVDVAEEHITPAAVEGSSAKLFPPDTILIALYGQGQTRGRTGRLTISATTNQACCALLPCDALYPQYLQWWLRSLYTELREDAKGGAQPNWNGGMIKDIQIALPARDRQMEFAKELDALQAKVDAVKALQAETAAELDAMLPAILDKAFKGEL